MPDFRDGDRVQFVRDEICTHEGVVRIILLCGGGYGPLDEVEELIQQWYYNLESMVYVVTARGYDHMIRPEKILGRFVSPNCWER